VNFPRFLPSPLLIPFPHRSFLKPAMGLTCELFYSVRDQSLNVWTPFFADFHHMPSPFRKFAVYAGCFMSLSMPYFRTTSCQSDGYVRAIQESLGWEEAAVFSVLLYFSPVDLFSLECPLCFATFTAMPLSGPSFYGSVDTTLLTPPPLQEALFRGPLPPQFSLRTSVEWSPVRGCYPASFTFFGSKSGSLAAISLHPYLRLPGPVKLLR